MGFVYAPTKYINYKRYFPLSQRLDSIFHPYSIPFNQGARINGNDHLVSSKISLLDILNPY